MKTDDELNYENEPRQMLGRVMRIGQILAESIAQQSEPLEEAKIDPFDHTSRDKFPTAKDSDLMTKLDEGTP